MTTATSSLDSATQLIRDHTARSHDSIVQLMRDICAIPSPEGWIKDVAERIGQEMTDLGFDEVFFDSMGNIVGRVGHGPRKILFDSHIDTVGLGNPSSWQWDPFHGKVEDGILYARGACDEKASTPGMIHALSLWRRLGLADEFTGYYFGNMEELCDGISPNSLVETDGIRPDFVVIGEPTRMQVYRGHRGRLEIRAHAHGKSCHAASPHLGVNAIHRMMEFIEGLMTCWPNLPRHEFLGQGTVVVSSIECKTPSINAVPDRCTITLDRRVTVGETRESVMAHLRSLPGAEGIEFEEMFYDQPAWNGFVFKVDKWFPAWVLEDDHPLVRAGQEARRQLWGAEEPTGRWGFSTNGIYWMGKAGIPSIGFGPGDEVHAHTVEDQVRLDDVVRATEFYALLPLILRGSL
ncbi:YgeY family selenium metabolism-linked hydrolase [Candidatus Sumerlaeota bacterium]|nr:YgeY family selenium metabolism-linked hydrolase [Candidatus Sumerlaeota bacterium]